MASILSAAARATPGVSKGLSGSARTQLTRRLPTLLRTKASSASGSSAAAASQQSSASTTSSLASNGVIRRGKATVSEDISMHTTANATANANTATGNGTSTAANPHSMASLCAAAAAGIVTVGLAAAGVEQATAASCPPFAVPSDNERPRQRFDQSTFGGRFAQMLLACDPRLLLCTPDQVQKARALLEDWQSHTNDRSMDRELWEAKRIVEASVHPDTGAVIPMPFRMSGYVPFNGPICVAMVASTSTAPILFWSFVNQSQNALVNYYNRNASSPMTNETLAISYAAAVTAALSVAFGLATVIQKRYPKEQAQRMMKWVAFPSAVVASSLNCYIVRSPEIDAGIPLLDPDTQEPIQVAIENDDGTTTTTKPALSKEAAKQGVYSTTFSRAILQAPVYFLPPLLVGTLPVLAPYLRRRPHLAIPVTTYMLLVSFGIGLPASVACFPQMATIDANRVEPEFQYLGRRQLVAENNDGGNSTTITKPYKTFVYNKGL
eukprot:CAMPEP_0119570486 /NCGR_PEP_ID=MMETSP1352-20130426/43639_1 /TAXON_ID=265584 /ORGANISM="Stauroneis constricta, Strain CCMP1120" /LENGTH=494 /DNA_ID=CAMNT_0007620155 /DNA_START=734 /DNA_END=2218 /DNA_ORIENTATION=-